MARAYADAANLIDTAERHRKSLKAAAFGGKTAKKDGTDGKRKAFALASETLRFRGVIDGLLDHASVREVIFGGDRVRDKTIAYVMLYDLVLGKGSIQGGGQLKRLIMQVKDTLTAALSAAKEAANLRQDASPENLLPASARRYIFPRYARVNLVKTSVEAAIAALRADGLDLKVDEIVPTLLVLPRGTELHEHSLVLSGHLILQDKSSCFSAQALVDGPSGWSGGDVIDACAAPGNKTTHVMSLLHGASNGGGGSNGGSAKRPFRVFAFDKDPKRLAVLRKRADAAGGRNLITTREADFLQVDPNDALYENVRGILLDPSCSGSGIVTAPERSHDVTNAAKTSKSEPNTTTATVSQGAANDYDNDGGLGAPEASERVKALAAFQLSALLKAFSFPQVETVVYSTCSLHLEENELVVARALSSQIDGLANHIHTNVPNTSSGNGTDERSFAANTSKRVSNIANDAEKFVLVPCLEAWPRRGLRADGLSKAQSRCLVRADPLDGDETNGFFVAKFVRRRCLVPQAASGACLAADAKPAVKHMSARKRKRPASAIDAESEGAVEKNETFCESDAVGISEVASGMSKDETAVAPSMRSKKRRRMTQEAKEKEKERKTKQRKSKRNAAKPAAVVRDAVDSAAMP